MTPRLFRHLQLRAWVLWGLIFAMPICGVSGLLAQWLGAQHHHRPTAEAHVQAPHSHAGLLRHHHRPDDRSVVVVGATSGIGDASPADTVPAAASLMPLVTLTPPPLLPLKPDLRHAWLLADAPLPAGRVPEPLQRPPDAWLARAVHL